MANRTGDYHHKDLRAALITEAADMIAEAGAGGLTMRAIGERLGVSRTAAYRHFADKNAVLVAVATVGFERLTERLKAIEPGSGKSGREGLRRIGEAYVRFALDNPAHYRLMYGREALTRAEHPLLLDAASALFNHIVSVIEIHQRNGTLKRQDPKYQAYVSWSALHGLASLLIEGQIMGPIDVDRLIRQITKTILDGMRADRPR